MSTIVVVRKSTRVCIACDTLASCGAAGAEFDDASDLPVIAQTPELNA